MSFRAALDMARDKGVDVILINEAVGAEPAYADMPKPWDAVGK